MKHTVKIAALAAVLLLAGFKAHPAQAQENCFSQKTGSDWVRVCNQTNGGFEFNFGAYGEPREPRYTYAQPVKVYYVYPRPYFIPPGHYKHYRHGQKHDDRHGHYGGYW